MLFDPRIVPIWRNSCLVVMLFCLVCAGYAYHVNTRRHKSDPEKQDFHPVAILLAPLAWPFWLIASSAFFLIKVVFYSAFLFLVTLALIVVRKPFLLSRMQKVAIRVGNLLLATNSFLIRTLPGKHSGNPRH